MRLFDGWEDSTITNNQVEELLEVSDASATRYLDELEREGEIKQEGEGGQTVYHKIQVRSFTKSNMKEFTFRSDSQAETMEFDQALRQLQGIVAALKESGLTVPDYCYSEKIVKESWEARAAFPVAR